MAARIALIFLVAVVIFQVMLLDATIIRRDAPADNTKSAADSLQETLNALQAKLQNITKDFQDNNLVQNITASLKAFGEHIQSEGERLATNIQTASKKN